MALSNLGINFTQSIKYNFGNAPDAMAKAAKALETAANQQINQYINNKNLEKMNDNDQQPKIVGTNKDTSSQIDVQK